MRRTGRTSSICAHVNDVRSRPASVSVNAAWIPTPAAPRTSAEQLTAENENAAISSSCASTGKRSRWYVHQRAAGPAGTDNAFGWRGGRKGLCQHTGSLPWAVDGGKSKKRGGASTASMKWRLFRARSARELAVRAAELVRAHRADDGEFAREHQHDGDFRERPRLALASEAEQF